MTQLLPDSLMNQGRVFIIDDDALILKVVYNFLSRAGYEVFTYQSAVHALTQLTRLAPDVILLDINMAGMDGYEACRQIKSDPLTADTPVIFLTGNNDAAGLVKGFECGAVDYLIKPVTQPELLARLRTHLALYRMGEQLRQQNERLREEIAERARAEEALRHSTERYLSIFNGVSDAILMENHRGEILEVNDSACRLFGYTREEFLSKNVRDIARPDRVYVIAENAQEMSRKLPVHPVEGGVKHASGECIDTEISFRVHQVAGEDVAMVVARDVSERKRMQADLIESQKLAGFGTVAAGVAHELNSPLQVVIGKSEGIIRRLKKDETIEPDDLHQSMEAIQRNGWRCATIVRSLLSYVRPSAGQFEPHDLNSMVNDALLLVEHLLLEKHVSIASDLSPDLPVLVCDPSYVSKPLVNLLENASDAMFTGGVVTVCSGYDPDTERLWLRVSDTGTGVPTEIRGRIFDPFFTTKPAGHGVGLGLSQVAAALRASDGEIRVEDVAPHGAIFTLFYPKDGPHSKSIDVDNAIKGRYSD